MMKGKKKVIIIILVILVIALIVIFRIANNSNKSKTSVNDFRNVKELSEYYGCKYIETKKSNEDGYKKDVFLEFNILPITADGVSNKYRYEQIISSISAKMNSKNYRIIDEKNNILINVNFTEDGKVSYIINNDRSFFEHLTSKYSIENVKEETNVDIDINSRVLSALVNNNWKTTNLNLGSIDSEMDKYDIYFDEGYKIRKINGRVYNIVFTNKYNEAVVNNIHTNSSLEQIREVLGKEDYYTKGNFGEIIGYKNEEISVYFSEGEISIYPNESGRDSDKFAELVTELIEKNNQAEFLSKLTDIWPDYARYSRTENDIVIDYPLKGVKIDFTNGQKGKIIIYQNYKGNITTDLKIEDVKESMSMPATYINLKLDESLLNLHEMYRVSGNFRNRHPYSDEGTIRTDKYIVYLNSNESICLFYSVDMNNIDSYIGVQGIDNIFEITDTTFAYSIAKKGIYVYDAISMKTTQLLDGTEDYEIKGVRNYTIYYDDKSIKLEQ